MMSQICPIPVNKRGGRKPKSLILLVRPAGFEPAAYGLEGRRNTFRFINLPHPMPLTRPMM